MFNFSEILFIAVLALVLIGPKQLPEVARTMGRLMNECRRVSNVFFTELKKPQAPTKKIIDELKNQIIKPEESTKNGNA